MEIDPTTSATGVEGALGAAASLPPTPVLMEHLDGIARQLLMKPDALRNAIAEGQSIAEVAAEHGVSRSSLLRSVAEQMQESRRGQTAAVPVDPAASGRIAGTSVDLRAEAAIVDTRTAPGGGLDTLA